jgi:hypothetical protein
MRHSGWLLVFLYSPTPTTTRSHICAYVTRMKDNVSRSFEMRHVMHDTRISSGQWHRCDATYGTVRCPRSYEISRTLDIYMSKKSSICTLLLYWYASVCYEPSYVQWVLIPVDGGFLVNGYSYRFVGYLFLMDWCQSYDKELDIDNKLHKYLKITGILNNVFKLQKNLRKQQ